MNEGQMKIGINGFGRIGRSVFRILQEREGVEVVGLETVYRPGIAPAAHRVERPADLLHDGLQVRRVFLVGDDLAVAMEEQQVGAVLSLKVKAGAHGNVGGNRDHQVLRRSAIGRGRLRPGTPRCCSTPRA